MSHPMSAAAAPTNLPSTIRRPTAWIPVGMSLAALAAVLVRMAVYGTAREADEGTTAHVFQLLMAGQLPIIAIFALAWFPRSPRLAVQVLLVQAAAGAAALAPVFVLGL